MISSDTTGSLAPVDHLDVVPNETLGPFKLGDSFWTVTEVLKNYRSTFRVVDISWEEEVSTSFLLSGLQICAARCAERPVPSVTLIRTPHRVQSCSDSTVTSPSSSHSLHLRVLNCFNGSISVSPFHPLRHPLLRQNQRYLRYQRHPRRPRRRSRNLNPGSRMPARPYTPPRRL